MSNVTQVRSQGRGSWRRVGARFIAFLVVMVSFGALAVTMTLHGWSWPALFFGFGTGVFYDLTVNAWFWRPGAASAPEGTLR